MERGTGVFSALFFIGVFDLYTYNDFGTAYNFSKSKGSLDALFEQ